MPVIENRQQIRRRTRVGLLVGAAVLATVTGTAGAKEITSGGGGGGGTTTCNPVSTLKVRADPRVGELGFASLDVDYGVKPCTNGQVVTVQTHVAEWFDAANVVWDDPAAPLSGRFTVNGIKVRTTYKITVDVYDAATGALAGTLSTSAAAIPKGV